LDVETRSPRTESSHVDVRRVRYVAFEGGGGKAAVFLGGIRALEDVGLLDRAGGARPHKLAGVSGSSTGAIPAALLSCQVPREEISRILGALVKDMLAPTAPVRVSRPAIRADEEAHLTFTCEPVAQVHGRSALVDVVLRQHPTLSKVVKYILPTFRPDSAFRHWMLHRMGVDSSFVDAVLANGPDTLQALYLDGGVFGCCSVRGDVDQIITASTQRVTGRTQANLTFRQHYEIFGSELRLSATNLTSGKSLYFSRELTPDLPLADAIRLCISLPFVVKPVYLTPEAAHLAGASADYAGLWIDGGVLNNAAAHAFDSAPGTIDPGMFALRLAADTTRGVTEPIDEQPVSRFLARAMLELLSSANQDPWAGIPQNQQVVTLNADGLNTHRFEPDAVPLRQAQDRAYEQVMRRFGESE
jgi:predicted acylesterase/phospholipase RssA